MLRWTAVTAGGGESAPGLRLPHAATLIGGSLLVLALFVPVRVCVPGYVVEPAIPFVLVVVAVAAIVGVGLVTAISQRLGWLILGLVLLDLLPVIVVLTAPEPLAARARTVWLVIPTVLAAANSGRLIPTVQWTIGCLLGSGVLLAAGLRGLGAALEIAVLVGILTVATVLVARLARRSADRTAELTRVSRTDPLTGVLNRRGLIEAFPGLLAAADAGSGRVGALLLDIDRFKQLNDRFGHAHGDAVLQQVASMLAGASGDRAIVGRIGGEELVVLLDGDPAPVADAVRARLAGRPDLGVTVSIGIVDERVDAGPTSTTLAALLLAADRALYRAKDEGRDRVRVGRVVPSTSAAEPPVATDVPVPVARERTPSSDDSLLFGLMLMSFSLVGFGAVFDPGRLGGSRLLEGIFVGALGVFLLTGAVLTAWRPRIGRPGMLTLCLTAEVVVLMALLITPDPSTRRFAATILVIPSLLIAAHLPRPVIAGQYVLAVTVCVWVGYQPGIGVEYWALAALQLAITIVGPAELIYRISRRHEVAADQLHRWIVTDPLTGAANRRGLQLAFAARTGFVGAVLAIDIDHFKGINDQLGHAGGDEALIRLVRALRTVIGPRGVVARTGGDEFVLVTGSGETRGPAELAQQVRTAGRSLPVSLSLSVGQVAAVAGSGSSIWDLVALADLSLTERRSTGRLPGTAVSPHVSSSPPVASEGSGG